MAICLPSPASTIHSSDHSVHVMRWIFRRDHETVVCELGLNNDDSAYELRINTPWNPIRTTQELFDDAVSAFQRHTAVERLLVQEGWSLESFESERVPRQPMRA